MWVSLYINDLVLNLGMIMKKVVLLFALITSIVRVEGVASCTVLRNLRTGKSVLLLGDHHELMGSNHEQLKSCNEFGITEFVKKCFAAEQNSLLSWCVANKKRVDIIFECKDFSAEELRRYETSSYENLAGTFLKLMQYRNMLRTCNYDCEKGLITLLPYELRGQECDFIRDIVPALINAKRDVFTKDPLFYDLQLFFEKSQSWKRMVESVREGEEYHLSLPGRSIISCHCYLERMKKYSSLIWDRRRLLPIDSPEFKLILLFLHGLNKSVEEAAVLIRQYNPDLSVSIYTGILNIIEGSKSFDLLGRLELLLIKNCDGFFADIAYFLEVLESQMRRDRTILIVGTDHVKSLTAFLKCIGYEIKSDWEIPKQELSDGRVATVFNLEEVEKNILLAVDKLCE